MPGANKHSSSGQSGGYSTSLLTGCHQDQFLVDDALCIPDPQGVSPQHHRLDRLSHGLTQSSSFSVFERTRWQIKGGRKSARAPIRHPW